MSVSTSKELSKILLLKFGLKLLKCPKVTSSVGFFEPRIHVERTGSVSLVQDCAMTLAKFFHLSFLPLRISCRKRGSGFSSIRYLVPFTKIFYGNFKISASNLLYPTLRRTRRRKIHQHRETLKKFNCELYHWLMNNTLITSNLNLNRSPFFYKGKLRMVNFLEQFASTVKILSSERQSSPKFVRKMLWYKFHDLELTNHQKNLFAKELTFPRNLKIESLYSG